MSKGGTVQSLTWYWDSTTLSYVRGTQVTGGAGSTTVTIARALNSSAADFQVTATLVAASTSVTVTPTAGSTFNVRALNSSAADLQVTATLVAASTSVTATLVAASTSVTVTPTAGSTFNVRALNSSAADLQMTASPLAGSTWNVRALNSSAADLLVTATLGTNLQTTVAMPSTGSSGLLVIARDCGSTTYAASTVGQTTVTTLMTSNAASRAYVYAYSITSTAAGPLQCGFYSGASLRWPIVIAAVSSAISGANMAVSAPCYLFRSDTGVPLTFNMFSSIVDGVRFGASFWVSA